MAQFTSSVASSEAGPFDTFAEAFADFWKRCSDLMDRGTTHMVIETACWIEGDFDGKKRPLMFYDAKEFAYDHGILDEGGQIALPPPAIDDEIVRAEFERSLAAGASAMVGEALETLSDALAV